MNYKIITKILLLIAFSSNILFSYSQISKDMMKYWYYRNRLNNYFVIPGEKIGESQIVCVRNSLTNDPLLDGKYKNVDYGQHGKYTGLYIGVLATEYYLLNANGQTTDAAKTLEELYNSLYAVKQYWDYSAEDFWGKTDSWDGFFIRGNVPCDFFNPNSSNGLTISGKKHIDLLNKGLDTNDYS